MKVRPQAIFSFILVIFFIVFVYQAQDWRLQARLYPWAIGIPMDQYKTSDSGRRLATVILAANEIGRPIIATPGIPAERVKILREAFMKAVNDPDLLEDAKKKKLDLDPVSGEELETLGKEIVAQPPEVVERIKKLLGT